MKIKIELWTISLHDYFFFSWICSDEILLYIEYLFCNARNIFCGIFRNHSCWIGRKSDKDWKSFPLWWCHLRLKSPPMGRILRAHPAAWVCGEGGRGFVFECKIASWPLVALKGLITLTDTSEAMIFQSRNHIQVIVTKSRCCYCKLWICFDNIFINCIIMYFPLVFIFRMIWKSLI